jgi:hypothetical protein
MEELVDALDESDDKEEEPSFEANPETTEEPLE